MKYALLIIVLTLTLIVAGCAPSPQQPVVDVTKEPVMGGDIMPANAENPAPIEEKVQEQPPADAQPTKEISLKELAKVEVKEYKGKRLDSIIDVRDVSIKGAQKIDKDSYRLIVTGMVDKRLELSYDEVLQRQKYSKVVQIDCVMGWSAKVLWEGILLKDLIAEAGPKADANTVIFHAVDGYTTSLPLDYIQQRDIILADKINNVTLNSERGWPFELVAEDKAGYKWIKWIDKIELSNDPEYEGYWEQRGYPISGDV